MGKEINITHASVLHNKKIFKQWLEQKKFYSEHLNRYKTLESIVEEDTGVDTNAIELYRKYKKENIILQKHNNKLIKKLEEKTQLFKEAKREANYYQTYYKKYKKRLEQL